MGNNINNDQNIIMVNKNIKTNIICPKCPLTPIISITSTKEGTLICEYRCPSFHMGLVKLEEMIYNHNKKRKKIGYICQKCNKENSEKEKKLKFCGICKQFLCPECIIEHDKIKSRHKILNHSKIDNSCLEHGNKIKFYCFTCLKNICTKCLGHKNHCFKDLKDIEPDDEFCDNLKFYFDEVFNYFNNIENIKLDNTNYDKQYLQSFKEKNILLLNFIKDLYNTYLDRKNNNLLNGEIIINLLNLSKFNLDTNNFYKDANLYLKNHIIIKSNSVSSICSFTHTKANYRIENLKPVFFKYLNIGTNALMKVLRMDYDLIAYNIDKILYFMKNEEKVFFKVKIAEKIKFFFQLKKHIVAIVSTENIYFYKLMELEPYIVPINVFIPQIDINNIIQIYGNIYQNLYILNIEKYIYKLVQQKEIIPNYDICLKTEYSIQIKDNINPNFNINNFNINDSYGISADNNSENNSENNNNENNNNNSYSESYNNSNSNNNQSNNQSNNDNNNNIVNDANNNKSLDNKSITFSDSLNFNKNDDGNKKDSINLDESKIIINKLIMYEETEKTEKSGEKLFLIKGIVFNYIILIENISLSIRNENNLNLVKTIKIRNNDYNLIVYNEHIIRPDENYIKFYTIPDLTLVSLVKVCEQINYFVIPNKNTFLAISDNFIEQLELNTWKKVSKVIYTDEILNYNKKPIIIGNNKELYIFQKDEIYRFEERP